MKEVAVRQITVYVWNGPEPLPAGTPLTAKIVQAMDKAKVASDPAKGVLITPRRMETILSGKQQVYLRADLPSGQPLGKEYLTKRKPRAPKYKTGDRVVMKRTVVLDLYGTTLFLERGGVLKVVKQYLTETGRIRYKLGAFTTRANTEPFCVVDRSENSIQRLAASDE